MSALRTFSAGISGIYDDNRHPCQRRLVDQELPQLSEGPGMQNCTLLAPSRYPAANVREVFHDDSPTSVFSFGNDLLADYMIGVGRDAVLAPAEFPEFATCPPSSLGLEFSAKSTVPVADAFKPTPAVVSAVRVSSDI